MCVHMWCVYVYTCDLYIYSVCTVWQVHAYVWYVCVSVLRREMLGIILEKTEPRCAASKKMLYFVPLQCIEERRVKLQKLLSGTNLAKEAGARNGFVPLRD